MCFFGDVVIRVASERGARQVARLHSEHGVHPIFEIVYRGQRVAFFQPGVGAPLAATFLEEAIDYGCRAFLACGGAGVLDATLALGHPVVVSAAVRDPRFLPLGERELPEIHIDVSVLGPAVPLRDPAAFRPGIDGIIVARDGRRALLLPEVATDQGWDAREMLDAACEKAGLEGHAWHDPRTRLFVFRTVRVSEGETPAGG